MSIVKKTLTAVVVGAFAAGVVAVAVAGAAGADVTDPPPPNPALRAAALAQETRTSECMSARGFGYTVALPPDVLIDEAVQAATAAGKQGEELHAAVDAVLATLPGDANESRVAQLPEIRAAAWRASLSGTDTEVGCGELAVTMTPEERAALEVDTAAGEAAAAAAPADPAVQAAEQTYVGCMAGQGYTVTDTTTIDEILETQVTAVQPAESAWPDPLPASATTTERVKYAALVAKLTLAQQKADALLEKGNLAHETCAGPYESAVAAVYERLNP